MTLRRYFFVIATILLAAASRLYELDAQSLWFDEAWSAYAAVQPDLRAAFEADPTNPPLYYLLLNITTRGFGDSPFGLRLTSLLLGLLVIPLVWQLARRLFDERAGDYAALLAAAAPSLWWASQEARMYTLLALLVVVAALAWHRLLIRSDYRAWLALLLAETLLLYAHNTGPVFALWLNCVTLLAWLGGRSLYRPDWRIWLAGQVAVGVAWLPWLISRFVEVQAANSAVSSGPQPGADLLWRMWQAVWTAPWEMVGREPVAMGLAGAAGVLALVLIPWQRDNARWLVVHVLVLSAGLVIGLGVIGNALHGRYLVMIVPLLLAALGAGVARVTLPLLRYGIAGVFVALLLVNITLARSPLYQHDDARGMVQYYANTLAAEDTVLAWSYADRYDLAYYWDRLGVPARRVTLPEGAGWPQIEPLLPQTGRVALNVWYTQRADYRGMLRCALGHGAARQPQEFTTYGMSSLLYDSSALRSMPQMRDFERAVLHNQTPLATVTGVGRFAAMTAEQALCVPVEIRLNQPLETDLRAAVVVRNALGWEIMQESGIFATPNQRTTSALQPGESATAYVLVRLPYGAPPGQYEIALRIFDETQAPSGYDMVAEDGHILGNTLPLGAWRVTPGVDWPATQRETELPYVAELPVQDDLTLLAHNIEPKVMLEPGQELRLELLWQGTGTLPDLVLEAEAGTWSMTLPPQAGPRDPVTLDWRLLRVPADAPAGAAVLRLADDAAQTTLATVQIDALPRIDAAPEVAVPVDQPLGDLGTLVGYTVSAEADRAAPLPVTLVWQADATAAISYTVFVQMLNADGQLIAQSDAVPAQGQRPTTGWRAGEYIVDEHLLYFNELAVPGEARLIVGMYDALTGQRLAVGPDGRDYLELPGVLTVR